MEPLGEKTSRAPNGWPRVATVAAILAGLAACSAPQTGEPSVSAVASQRAPRAPAASASSKRDVAAPLPVRADFAAALAKVKPGMDAADVQALLGPPDDVRTKDDPGGITATRTATIWRYGTAGHMTFATLGSVHLQADNRVQYVFGGKGAPPKLDLPEAALRDLLRTIDAVPSYNSVGHPLRLIRGVNALQPLGKDTAIAVLTEYLRVSSSFEDGGREGVFLVLRTLFDPPADTGVFPHMAVGEPSPGFPKNDRDAPRFPVVILDDIPFNVVRGYALGGLPEPPEAHLAWMRDHATLRAAKLEPTSTPIDTLRVAVGSPSTTLVRALGFADGDRRILMEQGAHLLESVVPFTFNASLPPNDAWRVFESERAMTLTWSSADDDYRAKAP